MALTETECRNAKPRSKPYKLTDGKGMHLLVQANGSRLWRLAYRFDGKQKTLAIGRYPALSIRAARAARDAARAELDAGVDPMAVKPLTEAQRTFEIVATEFHEIWKADKVKEHVTRVWTRMHQYAFPEIGHRPLVDIKPGEIIAMVRKMEALGFIDASRRLKQKCSEVFGYAIAMGYAEVDPTARVNKALRPRPAVEHMPMVPLKDLPKLVAAISDYQGNAVVRLALKFCLLTATRTGEIRGAEWSEIDLKAKVWRIPAARMKMGREHLVPLSRQALAVLKEAAVHRRGKYVFPGVRRPAIHPSAMLVALYELGLTGQQTVHGFRRLFSTVLNESGKFRGEWVERQLAHDEKSEIRAAYNAAEYLESRAAMMQWWADYLERDDFDALM